MDRLAGWLLVGCVALAALPASASQRLVSRTVARVAVAQVADPAPAPVLMVEPAAIGFMPGISLNVTGASVVAQEGGSALDRRVTRTRDVLPNLPVDPAIAAADAWYAPGAPEVSVPNLAYKQRDVFGYEAAVFDYTANPHTGLFDLLTAELVVPADRKVDSYQDFGALRALLVEELGAPAFEGVLLDASLMPNVVRRSTLHRLTASGRATPAAVWTDGPITVRLEGAPPGGRKARAAVARLQVTTDVALAEAWRAPSGQVVALP